MSAFEASGKLRYHSRSVQTRCQYPAMRRRSVSVPNASARVAMHVLTRNPCMSSRCYADADTTFKSARFCS